MAIHFRLGRARIAFFHDIAMAAISFPLSMYLRLGDLTIAYAANYLLTGTILFAAVAAPMFWLCRMYRGIWRYASLEDLVAITKAVTLTILIFLPLLFEITRLELFPRSLPFINWFVLMFLLGAPRFAYRLFKDRRIENFLNRTDMRRVPVLLVGANDAAELFIRQQNHDPQSTYKVVGVIDDTGRRVGRSIHGVPVLGRLSDLEDIVKDSNDPRPQRLVLTDHRADGAQVRDLLGRTEVLGLSLARLPRLADLSNGLDDKLQAQPIAIDDLLGRPQAVLDRDAMQRLIVGRTVLVTGAGGTIGSELVRQIVDHKPLKIILFEASEFNLYTVDGALAERHSLLDRAAILGDVRDRSRLDEVMAEHAPELVFHAAALKHVPIVEINPLEGVLTNTVGSRNVADACAAAGVHMMVQISTDKAVNPTNVMGVSKRLAESYCQALDSTSRQSGGTRFVTVRFGNVLGSTGSVVPLFQRQIREGGPITVTDPEVTRFFMSVREAVELVLQASAIGDADDSASGRIFVLEMGEPVRILDLARQMIRLAGMRPDTDIAIKFVGLRPGEKMYEELLHESESLLPTVHPHLMLADPPRAELPILQRALDELEDAARMRRSDQVLAIIKRLAAEHGGAITPERSAASQ